MKNKKQTQKKNKFGIFLGIGLGTILAGSACVLLAEAAKYTKPAPVYYNIKFDKGTGTEIKGKTEISFQKETTLESTGTPDVKKVVKKDGQLTEYYFVDWVDENNKTIYPYTWINKSTKLTATYSDSLPKNSFHFISFVTLNEDEYITGITKLAVPKGRTFASINKPQVHSTNENKNVFKGWALVDNATTPISLDMKIDTDMTLVPVYSTAVTFKWSGGTGSTLVSGSETTDTESNVKFSSLNQPTYSREDGLYLEGYYKDDPSSHEDDPEWLLENKWKANDLIPSQTEVKAYARWTSQSTENALLSFVQNKTSGQPTVEYQGNIQIVADKGAVWANINRPTPYAASCNVLKWQYSLDQEATDWTDLDDLFEFSAGNTYYIRPVMEKNISSLTIVGPSTVAKSSEQTYEVVVSPAGIQTGIEWDVFKDATCSQKFTQGEVIISEDGTLKTTNLTPDYVYIKASSTADPTKFAKLQVSVVPPYVMSCDYFTYDESIQKWLVLDNLFNDKDITLTTFDGQELESEPRATFNRKVYVGENVTNIPGGFLNSCTQFNSEIQLSDSVTTIGDLFLASCKSFNQQLDLSKIQHIGNSFMVNCESFNNGSATEEGNPLVLSSILTIGNRFMAAKLTDPSGIYTSAFNCPVSLNTSIVSIGQEFLSYCNKFNSNINFPDSLTTVGDFCMYGCDNFQATITVGAKATVFSSNDLNFAAKNADANIYKNGFTIGGTQADAFADKFPEIAQQGGEKVGGSYRTCATVNDKSFNTARWSYLIDKIHKYEDDKLSEAEFCNLFTIKNLTTGAQEKPTKMSDFVGQTKTINYLGRSHKIVVQGSCTDNRDYADNKNTYKQIKFKASDGTEKTAAFVFAFGDSITDPINQTVDAYRLSMPWAANASSDGSAGNINNNSDYLNSPLRKDVNGAGNGKMYFWKRYQKSFTSTKPLIDYMPTEIVNAMKTPTNRQAAVKVNGSWKAVSCDDKFFIATANEVFANGDHLGGDPTDVQGFMWTSQLRWGQVNSRPHRKCTTANGKYSHWVWTSTPRIYDSINIYAINPTDGTMGTSESKWLDFSVRPYWAI